MSRTLVSTLAVGLLLAASRIAGAHCDTMDGPVVAAARTALQQGDLTPVLKWVRKQDEAEVRAAFKQALVVRSQSSDAKALADRYFFETVVRVHRAGEGAPYTGLKPAGADLDPAVVAADKALEGGSADALVKLLTDTVAAGIRHRFTEALEKKKRADETVEAGRQFVAAYVEFVHYVERLHLDAKGVAEPTAGH
jgi:hypothetical protein